MMTEDRFANPVLFSPLSLLCFVRQHLQEGEDETFPRRDETNEQGDGSRSGNSEGEGEGEDGERNESAFVASGGMEKEFDVTLVSQVRSLGNAWILLG